jgi:magnesium chelatase family protein
MLARRLTTILPAMTLAEAIETTRIHRVAGLTGGRTALVITRPCRAPHHTISDVGLIGGGHVPRPGDVSLAHHGVRFLDAWPECRRHVLEVLRQPLSGGSGTATHVSIDSSSPMNRHMVFDAGDLGGGGHESLARGTLWGGVLGAQRPSRGLDDPQPWASL